jgi:hypothetical protein
VVACVWLTVSALVAITVFTAVAGLVDVMALAWGAALIAVGVTAAIMGQRREALRAAVSGVPRPFRYLFVTGSALLLVQLIPIAVFIVNPNVGVWLGRPWRPWQSAHSCVSSYWFAATNIDRTDDIYADSLYSMPRADPASRRQPRRLGPFNLDVYEYPPTFLPLPRAMAVAAPDFSQFRRLWFALNLGIVALFIVAIARRVDRTFGTHAIWLTPWVLASPAIVGTLQVGNGQLLFIAASVGAMWLFERRRDALGGPLLAYSIVSKLFPGVLFLYLVIRRDWRAAAWTFGWALFFLAASVADVGLVPFGAFLDHLPKLLSGEAFPAFRNPDAIGVNESVPGLVFKVGVLGGPTLGFGAARFVGWIYTVFLIGVTYWAGSGRIPERYAPFVWIALAMLATMRSPFLPHYAGFPTLWLATLMVAVWWDRPRLRTAVMASWALLAVNFGQGFATPAVNSVWTFVHTVVAFAVVATALRMAAAARRE